MTTFFKYLVILGSSAALIAFLDTLTGWAFWGGAFGYAVFAVFGPFLPMLLPRVSRDYALLAGWLPLLMLLPLVLSFFFFTGRALLRGVLSLIA